ncbi:adhesin transport system outer membrane protein [Pseudomonas nitritireducens]|uniref:Adhesin transport system outer membrane protein n=1 Tax=Pseudomonas nitroreducens TaxID=46680 RepID=A0A7W7KIG5_PSENT|nr:TolC family protein [Pseudomonas nitritireducens]MBB4863402.1 adhesin transport system outer membrane protein [Pseudomonas nitritireducens]
MKTLKDFSYQPSGKRWRFCRSALIAAISSLGAGVDAVLADDNLGGALSFYSQPKEATAVTLTGGALRGELVASIATATPSETKQPVAPVERSQPAQAKTPSASPDKAPAAKLDLSLPEEIKPGVAVSSLGSNEASLAYIRELVGTALRISPEMRQADANWQAAKGDVDQAKGARWPQVQISAASKTLQSSKSDYENNGSTTVQMVTPVYDFGAIGHTIDSRKNTANAQEEAKAQSEVSVAYNTASSVVELAHQQNSLEISDRYVARMRELVNMLSQIAEVDPGRRSEVVQARSRLLQAETARDLVQSKLQQTKTTLAKLVGEDITVPANAKWDWTPMPMQDALAQLNDTPSQRQARWEKEAALANADSVKSARFPKLNWVVGRNTGENMLDNKEPWSTGLAVEWTAFSGGSASAAQRAAYARANAAEQKMESSRRESEYLIRNLAEQRDLSASRVQDYQALLAESDRVRKMFYDQWYHLGKRTLLDVLIAENEYYTAQIAASDTYFDAKTSDLRIRAETSGLMAWLAPGDESATR